MFQQSSEATRTIPALFERQRNRTLHRGRVAAMPMSSKAWRQLGRSKIYYRLKPANARESKTSLRQLRGLRLEKLHLGGAGAWVREAAVRSAPFRRPGGAAGEIIKDSGALQQLTAGFIQ